MRLADRSAYAAFAGASLIWGSTFFVIRVGNESVPPLWAAALRLAIATALFLVIVRARRERLPRGASLVAAGAFGLFEFGVNFALLYWGELRVPSGVAAVFYATVPLTSTLFAWLLGTERPDLRRTVGAAAAFVGVAGIFWGEVGVDVPFLPLLAVLGAATAAAFGNVMLNRAPSQPVFATNAVAAVVGLAFCLTASLIAGEDQTLPTTLDAWWPILYLTLAGSLGAFTLFTFLLHRWKATRAGMIAIVVPVIALIFGAVAAGERPSWGALAGAALVLGGVLVVLRGRGAGGDDDT